MTRDEADKLAESTEAAAILSLGVAVPTPLAPPTIASTPAVAVATAGRTPSPLQAVGEGASAAQALLAAAFAASPAATTAVSAKVADGKAAEPLAPDLETSLASKAELPSLVAALKLTPVKPAAGGDAKTVQQAQADMAAPAESAPVDTRPLQSATVSTVLNGLVSAALQPTAAQPAPAEAAAVQTGGVADAALEQQLDLAHEGEWLDRLARDIARTAGAEGGLRFRLNPENLGSLHVELTQGQTGASLKLTAETEAARAIIADAQPRLVAEARAQGVRIAETHVDLGSGGHMQSGEHRRQEAERGQEFVRTSRSAAATETEATETTVNASERYA